MDPLSATVSAIALCQAAKKVFDGAKTVYKAPEEKEQCKEDLEDFQVVLEMIEDRKEKFEKGQNAENNKLFQGLHCIIGEKEANRTRALTVRTEELHVRLSERHGLKGVLFRLKWLSEKDKVKDIFGQLRKWKEHVKDQLERDDFQVNYGNRELLVSLNNSDEERKKKESQREHQQLLEKILGWVSLENLNSRQDEIIERCEEVGLGVLKSSSFISWREGRSWALRCWADAGTGKTMLCAQITNHLRDYFFKKNENVAVLCIYLNHKEQASQTINGVIRSLLRQLISLRKPAGCSEKLIGIFKDRRLEGVGLHEGQALEVFIEECESFDRVIIVADGLDEGSGTLQSFLEKSIENVPWNKISLLLSSREAPPNNALDEPCNVCGQVSPPVSSEEIPSDARRKRMEKSCRECEVKQSTNTELDSARPAGFILNLHFAPTIEEIREYVEKQISNIKEKRNFVSGRPLRLLGLLCMQDGEFEAKIIDNICDRAGGKFLVAQSLINWIDGARTEKILKNRLASLPRDIFEIYHQQMKDIQQRCKDPDTWKLVQTALSYIRYARRPLKMGELIHALGTDPEQGFDRDNLQQEDFYIHDVEYLIMKGGNDDVRFLHHTWQEYFEGPGSIWLEENTLMHMARITIAYIAMPELSQPLQRLNELKDFESRQSTFPFMSYAYENWGFHAVDAGLDDQLKRQVLELLEKAENVTTMAQALFYSNAYSTAGWQISKGASALHLLAWFDLVELLSSSIDDLSFVDVEDRDGFTPLMIACRQGHERTVTTLLAMGASVNETASRGQSAVSEAVNESHIGVLKVLIACEDVEISRTNPWNSERTVLMEAAVKNEPDLVDALLIAKNLNINQTDATGDSALNIASAHVLQPIVQRLLRASGIDPNLANSAGYTALSSAAAANCEKIDVDGMSRLDEQKLRDAIQIIELLLERDADSHARDRREHLTPLMLAVSQGNTEIVKVLLDQPESFEITETDGEGRGLVHIAAARGQLEIMKMVIGKDLDSGRKDDHGRTPLHEAARNNRTDCMQYLLNGDDCTSVRDVFNRTPYDVAFENDAGQALDILEERSAARIPRHNIDLPLWSLARIGGLELVQEKIKLIGGDGIARETPNPDTGETAVHCACSLENGNSHDMLRILLKTGMSATSCDNFKETPLHVAVRMKDPDLIRIILEHVNDSNDLNAKDAQGYSPLEAAYFDKTFLCAFVLILGGATIDEKRMLVPLLFAAIAEGSYDAVKMLIDVHNAPIMAKDEYGVSTLQRAKRLEHGDIMQLLNANKSRMVGSPLSEISLETEDYLHASVRTPFSRPDIWDSEEAIEEFSAKPLVVAESVEDERNVTNEDGLAKGVTAVNVSGPIPEAPGVEDFQPKPKKTTKKVMLPA